MTDPVGLDEVDLKILAALQDDGRQTNQELADRIHLSASQCSRRRIRLEETGILRGYRADLDPELLGLHVTCFTRVTLNAHSHGNSRDFIKLVQGLDCVLEAHSLTGDSDYVLKIIVPDLKTLSTVVNRSLLAHAAVSSVRSSVVLDTLKASAPLPLPRARPAR